MARSKLEFPDNDRFCVSRASLLAICNRDETAAKILNLFNSCPPRYLSNRLIKISSNQIVGLLQNTCSQKTVIKSLKWLNDSGMISAKKEQASTTVYSVNFDLIQSKIDSTSPNTDDGYGDLAAVILPPQEIYSGQEEEETVVNLPHLPLENYHTPTVNLPYHPLENYHGTVVNLPHINIEDTEKDVFKDLAEDKTLTNTSNGSVYTTPLTTVAEAPLTSVAYAPSLAFEKEKFEESSIESTSAIITTPTSLIGLEDKKMSTTDVLTEIFLKYSKVPEKKRDAKCKGSASRLMQNWGDKLKPVVDEVGEEAVVAMENFIQDEYWLAKGLPLPAFKSQYRKYLSQEEPESEANSEIRSEFKPSRKSNSAASGYQSPQFAYTDHHPIAVFCLRDQSGATLRKREALDILQQVGGDLEAEGRAAIGFKIDSSMYGSIEEWHSRALLAYKSIKHRDYPVLTEPIREVLNA